MDLKNLSNPKNPKFAETLKESHKKLTEEQADSFFQTVIHHLKKIDIEKGKLILETIKALIRNEDLCDVFVNENYVMGLPIGKEEYYSDIMEIYYILASSFPDAFNQDLVDNVLYLLPVNPSKTLKLITLYSQQMEYVEDPWPMLDILFKQHHLFESFQMIPVFCKLLTYLCLTFDDFLQARGQFCWIIIETCLGMTKHKKVIITCYQSLADLSTVYHEGVVNIDTLCLHMKNPRYQPAVFELLIQYEFNENLVSIEFITTLLNKAQVNSKATLILMKFSENVKFAELLVTRFSWLALPLPTLIDTIRLFLVVFQHEEVQSVLHKTEGFVAFLRTIVDQGNVGVLTIFCTIVRRIDVKPLLEEMSQTGLLSLFFNTARTLKDKVSLHSGLLVLDVIARAGFTPELVEQIPFVISILQKKSSLHDIACYVAADMSHHSKCLKILKEAGLEPFFEQYKDEEDNLGNAARKFLKNCQRIL